MRSNLKILQRTTIAITIIILLFGFTETANMVTGNWYQQFMPNIGNRTISDITFLDILTGYATAFSNSDTNYILKTTNGGDNWSIIYRNYALSNRVQFLNTTTGYVCGGKLIKTTNGGITWFNVNTSGIAPENMFVLNEDTIWLTDSEPFNGGVFYTTNAGVSWQQQFSGGNQNPNKIYMFNARIGFISNNSALPNIYKTTNSGMNWAVILNNENFSDIHFTDSLTGWKCSTASNLIDSSVKKTTNGGLNWTKQQLPTGPNLIQFGMARFCFLNQDTIWGVGSNIFYPNSQVRGILYRTTNGGTNWLFQIPDTSIHIYDYYFINFVNKNIGWAYAVSSGIHTTTGGDSLFFTGIQQFSNSVPKVFKLYQNYPNPFNPSTNIKYQIVNNNSYVLLRVFDITGKGVTTLINQEQRTGVYQVDFSGSNYSSGVYFYKIEISTEKEVYSQTKKMILLK